MELCWSFHFVGGHHRYGLVVAVLNTLVLVQQEV